MTARRGAAAWEGAQQRPLVRASGRMRPQSREALAGIGVPAAGTAPRTRAAQVLEALVPRHFGRGQGLLDDERTGRGVSG